MKMKIPTSSMGNGYYGYESLLGETLGELHEQANGTPEDLQSPSGEDFSEYMWMEHEEEFDKQVMQQLEEEALMQQCMEAMLEEEHEGNGAEVTPWDPSAPNNPSSSPASSNNSEAHLSHSLRALKVQDDVATQSLLNPNAAEFVPRGFGPAGSQSPTPSPIIISSVNSPAQQLSPPTHIPSPSS